MAAVALRVMSAMLQAKRRLMSFATVCAAILAAGMVGSGAVTSFTENLLYQDNIILTRQTPYQRIVVTRWHDDLRLFIDGHLQFSTVDEHRYHEALVHPAMSASPGAKRALILGGGDAWLPGRFLKYAHIESIDLVDWDAEIVRLFQERPFWLLCRTMRCQIQG